MAKDAPDGVKLISATIIVDNEPVPDQPANETPISETEGKVTNSDQTYQTLASWTVTSTKSGVLYGIELDCNNFPLTKFKLTIGGVVKWADKVFNRPLNIHFADAKQPASTIVLLQGASNDGTEVNMWGHIEGKEVG